MKNNETATSVAMIAMSAFLSLAPLGAQAGETAGSAASASAASSVVCGCARFTVLTPRLIRMEYAADGKFEDRASLAFVNRDVGETSFRRVPTADGRGVTIDTGALRLSYAGGPFAPTTLSVASVGGTVPFTWRHGDRDVGNLYGTTRTLDGVDSWEKGLSIMEGGILSRNGWTVIDESRRHLFEKTDDHWGEWVVARPEDGVARQDLYFFGYGHDYKAALADFTRVAGRIPLPPRWAFGYWWSRYWQYSDDEIRTLVENLEAVGLPLDVMIIDMDWHDTWGLAAGAAKDEFGQSIGWSGYTWKKELFPKPSSLMDWLHARGIKSALNLHPASGVQPYESCYADFVKDYGWQKAPEPVPYRLSEAKWADSWFKTVLGPHERQGVDFWWLDWQQWMTSKYVKDLSCTFWLNHVMNHHMSELDGGTKRPLIYHRWGGLGSHRYQVGFSGDTVSHWDVLGFEAWFTATSGNVGYGYWGHDLGGHGQPAEEKTTDSEKYLRWMQYGVFSPVFKTHSAKDLAIERRIWKHADWLFAFRDTYRLRYRLAPYIYTAARAAFETGVSICRPLYWDWPEEEKAYDPRSTEYLFGPDILATPVCRPADKASGLATVGVWLPPHEGGWYDVAKGEMLECGDRARDYAIDEIPWFVRAGAVIPLYPDGLRNLKRDPGALELLVAPGGRSGACEVYEDDGEGAEYATEFAKTRVRYEVVGRMLRLTVAAREGTYAGMLPAKRWAVRLPLTLPPRKVVAEGRELGYSRLTAEDTWTYDGAALETVVTLSERPCDRAFTVCVELDGEPSETVKLLSGKKGLFARFAKLSEEYKYSYGEMVHPWAMLPDEFLRVSQMASLLTEEPENVRAHLARFERELATFIPALMAKRKLSLAFAARLAAAVGQPAPEPLPEERYETSLPFGCSVKAASKTATFTLTRKDARHFVLRTGEPVIATVTIPLFSGFVRCRPVVDGRRRDEFVLTRGVGKEAVTWIFLAPCYGTDTFEIETCVDVDAK